MKTAGLAPGTYEVALRRALLASEAAPWNLQFIHTLGAAYYRVKQYDSSLATMAWAARLRYDGVMSLRAPVAYDLVYTAMAHHQLGHRDEAQAALDRVRPMLRSTDTDLQALFEEATALIGR